MGYKPVKQLYNISFEDRPGLVVTAKSVSLGKMNYISTLNVDHRETDKAKRMELFQVLTNYIVSWNIVHPEPDEEEEGTNICAVCGLHEDQDMPVAVKYMECLEIELVSAILSGWMLTIARASIPKEMRSNNGGMNGPSIPLSDGMTEETTRLLERLQNPTTLPMPNLSSD